MSENGNLTGITGCNIETLVIGAQALGHAPEPFSSSEKSQIQPNAKVEEVETDSTTRRKIPLLEDEEQRNVDTVHLNMERLEIAGRASMLTDRARYLLAYNGYEGVSKLLDDPVITSSEDIVGKTLLAEAHLMLGREAKALKVIEALKKVLVASHIKGEDIMAYAKDLAENNEHFRALILFPIACDIIQGSVLSTDDVFKSVESCFHLIDQSVQVLNEVGGRARIVASDFGIAYMEQIHEKLRAIEVPNPESKVQKLAYTLNRIGLRYRYADDNKKSLKYLHEGAELLEQQFSHDRLYGHILNNIGVAHYNLSQFNKAEGFLVKAIAAYEHATNFKGQSHKQVAIEHLRKLLKKARAKLG